MVLRLLKGWQEEGRIDPRDVYDLPKISTVWPRISIKFGICIYIYIYNFLKFDNTFHFLKILSVIFTLNIFAMNWESFLIASKIVTVSYELL